MSEKKEATGFAGIGQRAEEKAQIPPIGDIGMERTVTEAASQQVDRSIPATVMPVQAENGQSRKVGVASGKRVSWPPVIIGIIVLVIVIGNLGSNHRSSSSSNNYSFTPDSAPSNNTGATTSSGAPGNVDPPNAGTTVPTIASPASLQEEKPEPGSGNLLTAPQIRYCLAEKVRIQAMSPNPYDAGQISTFNSYVDDYNSRCRSFRYYQGSFDAAQRDVEANRTQLIGEGQARLSSVQPGVEMNPPPQAVPALPVTPQAGVWVPPTTALDPPSNEETNTEMKSSDDEGSDEED